MKYTPRLLVLLVAIAMAFFATIGEKVHAAEPLNYGPLPFPEIDPDTWVLIEYWPTVKGITMHAYFMESLSEKNQNLCAAMKKVIDRDAAAVAERQGTPATTSRKCFTLRDAVAEGYVEPPNE